MATLTPSRMGTETRQRRNVGWWLSRARVVAACLAVVACRTAAPAPDRHVTILYTNDEHGWLEPAAAEGRGTVNGPAAMLARWKDVEGYRVNDDRFLVLSGGDNWTGPSVSTLFQGESSLEVMEALGYDASAIGNHEFDFGLALLRQRLQTAPFLYLAANIFDTEAADGGFRASTILDAGGVRVGLIGLSTRSTPLDTLPSHVAGLEFRPYEEALEREVPRLEALGAELLVVVGHLCEREIRELLPTASRLGIDLVTGGHCNEIVFDQEGDVTILIGGAYWRSYGVVGFAVNANGEVRPAGGRLVRDLADGWTSPHRDQTVDAIVARWSARVDGQLGEVIGFTGTGVAEDVPLYNFVTDAQLGYFPEIDVALQNRRGIRQGIAAGKIHMRDLLDLMPFENDLYVVELSGRQLEENLRCCDGIWAGVEVRGDEIRVAGEPLAEDRRYNVVVSRYMLEGGGGYRLAGDGIPIRETGVHYRFPVIEKLRALATSPEIPLEGLLDTVDRRGNLANGDS